MSKKLCSILLAFAMIMLTITNAFAAVQFENVEGSTFKIENLKELGFISGYEDGSLRLDQYIKRSEFAKVLVNAFDKEQEAEAIKGKFKPFKDVDESHWANGIISIVKNLKGVNNTQIINGYPDGTFRPEEHITNAEALKMLVCCVKGDLTEEMYKNAEWFESWVKWAIELGIIGAESDVPNIVDMNAKVTRGNVFTMFYNAFEEDEVERPIEKTEEKEPEKKTDDKKEEKSIAPDRHAGSRHDRYDRYPEYPYYPDLPIVPFEPSVPEVKTYTISIDSSANGIVSADKYSAEEGEIVNLRIMPNEGYKLDTLEVKDEFGNKVQLVNQWFAMPSSNVVVSAKFVEETVKPVEFDKENIKNIEIKSEPSKMNYVEGEKLDLSGFVVTLTDINDNTVEVPYNNFLEYGIDVEPVDGTELTSEDNGKQITVSKSGIEAKTNQIEVTELQYNDDLFASIEIISEPENLTYNEGDSLELNGLKVRLTDSNEKTKEVALKDFAANGITIEPADEVELTTLNNGQAIKVTKGNKTVETNPLTVSELQYNDDLFASLEIITEPENLSYTEKENLDLTGLKVKLTDTNGKTKEVDLQDFGANGITTEPENEATLSLTDNGEAITVTKGEVTKTTTGKLEITELTYDDTKFASLEIIGEPENLSYTEKENLNLTGLKVKLTDTNGKTKEVDLQDFAANGITTEPANEVELTTSNNGQAVKVTKGTKTVETNPLTVTELPYDDTKFAKLEIVNEPTKLSYKEKDQLDLTGLKVRLTDSNGKTKEVELKDFAANGITTDPADEVELTTSNNGQAVKVTKGTKTVETNPLTVTELPYDDTKFAKLEIVNEPTKLSYTEKDKLDLTGLKVKLTDTNGKTKEVELQDFATNGITTEPANGAELKTTDNGKAISVIKSSKTVETTKKLEITELEYNDKLFASLEIINEPANLSYTEKEKLDLTGLKVKLTDSNGKSKEVELKDFADNGITTEPANGVELSLAENDKAISVTKASKTVETKKKLEVAELEYDDTKFETLDIIAEPTNLSYTEKEKLELTGLKVKLTDSNGKSKEVELKDFKANGITTEPANEATLSLQDNGKAISVTKGEVTATTKGTLEIAELTYDDTKFESLDIIAEPVNLSYKEKDKLDLTGLKVRLTDSNGKTKEVALKDFAANGITTEPTDGATLSLENNGKAISVIKSSKTVETTKKLEITELEYNDKLFASLEIINEPANLSYKEKDQLDLTGLKVKLTDTNGKTKEIELKDFEANGIETVPSNEATLSLADNEKPISVKKGEETKTTTGTLEITELPYNDDLFASLEIITEPTKLSYKEKEQLDLTGLKVKLTDSNGKTKEVELKDFAANGITTAPASGAELKTSNNGQAVTVTKETKTVETNSLTVTELPYNDDLFAKLEIISEPTNLKYKEKDKLDLTGLKVRLTDKYGKTKEVELKDFANYKITTEPANEATLSLADKGKAISVKKGETTATTKNTIEIIVFNPNKIVNIKVKNQPNKMVYDEGMALDLDGMVITLTDENGLTKDVEFARGAETEYSKYIKTSIEDRDILGEEHNEKFIIVSLNQNPNIKTQTKVLIVKHYFIIGYKGVWIGGKHDLDKMFLGKPIEDKVEDGSLWEYPSMNGQKINLDRAGYEFIGWQTEDGKEIKTPFIVTKDMIMVAKWRDKNQPIKEYLKEQFETAAKLSTSIVKDKNKESLGLEYNEKVITIVPAKMEAFNIAEYNLINELQKLVKENFLTGYTINSKIRELNSSLTENQMLEYLIRDFASIANVNVSGLDYSNKSQVSDKVKEILTTLANSEKTVEITVNLAKDDVNTIDVYKFVFLKYKDMSASEVESTNNFYNDLMKNTVNDVNKQGIWENDPNNSDVSVKIPVFKTEYDGNKNVYTININTRYTDLLAKQTGGTGFKTAVVNFLTGGHVGKNGKVQNNLQKVKITQIGTGKKVIVDREQLNEIVHVNLSNMKSLLAPFSYIFMPEGKDVNTLALQDLVGQEATFEYTYVNENYETYTVVRTVKFDTFTE